MHFDLKRLANFVAVAEELNFHRAAERLSTAQPAVSRMVQELETSIGAKLLERTTRNVRLTDSGRFLLKEAREILSRAEAAEHTARLLGTGTKRSLNVGYTTITGHSLVPEITRAFRKQHPDVRLNLSYLSAPEQRDLIIRDKIDVGFLVGSFKSSEIETSLVARHRIVALLPPGHPLAAKSELTVAEVARQPLIMGTDAEWPTFRRIIVDMFQKENEVMQVYQEATSLIGILGLVTSGLGITIFTGLPSFCAQQCLVSRPILTRNPVVVETHVAWRKTGRSRTIREFVEISRQIGNQEIWN